MASINNFVVEDQTNTAGLRERFEAAYFGMPPQSEVYNQHTGQGFSGIEHHNTARKQEIVPRESRLSD